MIQHPTNRAITPYLLALLAIGCGAAPERAGDVADDDALAIPLAGPASAVPSAGVSEGILPAYQTERELREAKADRIDVRASHAELYGPTRAPAGRLRALAEWEPADGVLIAWAGDLSPFFADLVLGIGDASTVYVVTPDIRYTGALRDYLTEEGVPIGGLKFFEYAHEAFWARDYGPWVVETEDGRPAFIDVGYYPNRHRDDAIPTLLGNYFGVPTYRPGIEAEGGNFMTNGEGVCAVTSWMLEQNGLSRPGPLADRLRDYMGCDQTVVVQRMDGEGTGHIDMFAKFTSPGVVLVGSYDSRVEPINAAILDRAAAKFAGIVRPNGQRLQVVRIPMPSADHPVYRSYTNSLLINGVAVVPTYDTDRHLEGDVRRAYRQALPGYEIAFVDSSDIIEYGGAVHCVTMGFQTEPVRRLAPLDPEIQPPSPAPTPDPTTTADGWSVRADAPIRDRRVTRSTLTVGGDAPARAGRVSVTVDIAHTYVGDLVIAIEHAGREAVLFRGQGAGRDLRETFVSDAFGTVAAGGDWTLVVADGAEQDEGLLRSWEIAFGPGNDDGGGGGSAALGPFESAPDRAIPDGGRATDTITLQGDARVETVTVNVEIRHTYVGDLKVTLSHAGQRIDLHRNGGGAANDLIRSWTVGAFEGLPAAGDWTLTVDDTARQDVGRLVSWSLEL